MQLKWSSAKWRPFCPGEDDLSTRNSTWSSLCLQMSQHLYGAGPSGGSFLQNFHWQFVIFSHLSWPDYVLQNGQENLMSLWVLTRSYWVHHSYMRNVIRKYRNRIWCMWCHAWSQREVMNKVVTISCASFSELKLLVHVNLCTSSSWKWKYQRSYRTITVQSFYYNVSCRIVWRDMY